MIQARYPQWKFHNVHRKETAVIHDSTSSTLTVPVPLVDDSDNTVGYLRFCGLGTVDGTVYITYTENQTVTEETWIDTGVAFGGGGRTGTPSFLLLGLLGVNESDLAKEYELSSFSDIGFDRLRTTTKAVGGYDYVGRKH